MSKVRKPIFRMANHSTQSCGWFHQRSVRAAMLPPKLSGHGVQLNRLLQHWVVPVPLHEICSAHKGAMFARPAVVMPEIEEDKIDGMRKRRPGEKAVLLQAGHQVLRGLYAGIRILYDRVRLGVNAIVCRSCVALGTDLLHLGLCGSV